LLGKAQLIRLLQIHPEFSCGIEKRRQTYRSITRDASLSFVIDGAITKEDLTRFMASHPEPPEG
jgi:hypothetical protein